MQHCSHLGPVTACCSRVHTSADIRSARDTDGSNKDATALEYVLGLVTLVVGSTKTQSTAKTLGVIWPVRNQSFQLIYFSL